MQTKGPPPLKSLLCLTLLGKSKPYLGSIPIISHIHIHTISDEIQDNFRKSQKGLLLFEPLPSLLEIFTDVEKNWQTNQFTSLLEFFVCVYRGSDLCDTNQGHRGRRGYGRFAPIHLNTAGIPSNTANTDNTAPIQQQPIQPSTLEPQRLLFLQSPQRSCVC